MKINYSSFVISFALAVSASSAFADSPGNYRCDIELSNGQKTVVRLYAKSDSNAARLVKESRSDVKYINCFKID